MRAPTSGSAQHCQTRAGSRESMSTCPSTIGSSRSHRPPGERKSGRPLAVETPGAGEHEHGRIALEEARERDGVWVGHRIHGSTVAADDGRTQPDHGVRAGPPSTSGSCRSAAASTRTWRRCVVMVANGLLTIPLALALDGVPGHDDLRPLGLRGAGRRVRGRRLRPLLPRARDGRPRGRRPDHRPGGRHRRARRDPVRRARRRPDRASVSRSRSPAAAWPRLRAGAAPLRARCRPPAPPSASG